MTRHWVVGTGKSLLNTPLDLLKDEITWGVNRIHLFYGHTSWRPNYFAMVDFNSQNPQGYWRECIAKHWKQKKYLWDGFRDGHPYMDFKPLEEDVPNTVWIPRCKQHHYYMGDNLSHRAESWHLPEICTAYSGLFVAIQGAVLEGATEIYLLGCDLYESDYRQNFFTENYTNDPRPRNELDNANMIQGHKVAKLSCPVPIYNATVGGKLEVHERRDMCAVLKGEYD